jgi:hypothetical protein
MTAPLPHAAALSLVPPLRLPPLLLPVHLLALNYLAPAHHPQQQLHPA